MESVITVKGQATIPKAGLRPGGRVKFFVQPDGTVALLPKLLASALRGIVKSQRRKAVSAEKMAEAVARGAAGERCRATRR